MPASSLFRSSDTSAGTSELGKGSGSSGTSSGIGHHYSSSSCSSSPSRSSGSAHVDDDDDDDDDIHISRLAHHLSQISPDPSNDGLQVG